MGRVEGPFARRDARAGPGQGPRAPRRRRTGRQARPMWPTPARRRPTTVLPQQPHHQGLSQDAQRTPQGLPGSHRNADPGRTLHRPRAPWRASQGLRRPIPSERCLAISRPPPPANWPRPPRTSRSVSSLGRAGSAQEGTRRWPRRSGPGSRLSTPTHAVGKGPRRLQEPRTTSRQVDPGAVSAAGGALGAA